MTMSESDGTVEVLKEIRDEIRNVRTELLDQMRSARTGVRTEVVERGARWRLVAMAGTGAVALVALVLSLRSGGQPPTVVAAPPAMASASPASAAAPAPTPVETPAQAPSSPSVAAARPAVPKPAPRVASVAPVAPAAPVVPKKRVKPEAPAKAVAAAPGDDDETMAFSPPAPRRVRVHKMSYDSPGFEPAKL
jgi:hypothetical protein